MAKVIEAIYEKGVFKPLQKVDLKEGERVKIEIKRETLLEKLRRYRVKVDEDVLENFLKERR
jgi:predicted DNA-binding antitoxin AbrB/MazE fold protein